MPVRFETSSYPGGVVYAHMLTTYSPFASIIGCPLGWAIRWYHVELGVPGANEIAPTMDAAKLLCEQFMAGLEIVPWEAEGAP